jgi:carbon starvation protein CstA
MLWTATAWLAGSRKGRWYLVTLLPALFMTSVCVTFILVDKTGFGLPAGLAPWIGLGAFAVSAGAFYALKGRAGRSS